MNWESLFETINKKIKNSERERDLKYLAKDYLGYNHHIGRLSALYEMKELLRKRRDRQRSRVSEE